METTVRLYSLTYRDVRSYLAALLFVAGNVILPQLFHLLPQGGVTWLPIYFFTLVAAYKYGWAVGLMTAVLSPLTNAALFGMPAVEVLPAILTKSTLLALAAGWAARRFHRVSLPILAAVVLAYQLVGSVCEWAMVGSWAATLQDFRVGVPGMVLQVVGGYLVIRYLLKR